MPDTQFYCDCRLKLSAKWGNGDLRRYFFKQTEWVRDNQERLNIAFLVHEGDIVQADAPEEWTIAKKAMSVLDGKVPYCMCLGNHDMGFEKADNKYGGNIGVNRTTHFNTYFPREKFAERPEFGSTFDPDRHDNSWYHFEAAGLKFLIVALEYHPRDEVLDWANRIVAEHPDHRVIALTHSYLKGDKTRTNNTLKLKGNNGEQMWQKFVRKHKNMFMVLCGHFSGEAVLTSAGDHDNQVHQILSDYQGLNTEALLLCSTTIATTGNQNLLQLFNVDRLDKVLVETCLQHGFTVFFISVAGQGNEVNFGRIILFSHAPGDFVSVKFR